MNEIKLFKLLTSEEIVTRVIEENDDHYLLEKPRLCAMQQSHDAEGHPNGNYLVLLPWIMYATDPDSKTEKDIKLFKRVIAGESVAVPLVMEKEYQTVTSSIQLV